MVKRLFLAMLAVFLITALSKAIYTQLQEGPVLLTITDQDQSTLPEVLQDASHEKYDIEKSAEALYWKSLNLRSGLYEKILMLPISEYEIPYLEKEDTGVGWY
jgi:hypothetical protein